MITLSVTLDDARLQAAAREAPDRLQGAVSAWLQEAGQLAVGEMKRVTFERFKHPRGQLMGSIRASIESDRVTIGPNVPYAGWVDTGTQPHVIRPVNGSFLHFVVNGQDVYATEVHHPGFAGHHYVEETARRIEQPVARLLEARLGEVWT
ncbi:MAG: phage virion morphogenesis protein [Thermoplasmatota archaeon]